MMTITLQGGPIMLPLLLCSLIALTVIIERAWFWWRIDRAFDPGLFERLLAQGGRGDWPHVEEMLIARRDYVSVVLAAGVLHRGKAMSKIMAAAGAEEVGRMRRFMPVLDTIITAAPLLGILGTVIGIIVSFDALGSRGIDDPMAVTGGIAQALITTAAGLTVAIFAVFPYNYFNTRVARAVHRMETWATRLETVVVAPPDADREQQEVPHAAQWAN